MPDMLLPVFEFDHRRMDREQNWTAWVEATSALFDVHLDDPASRDGFYADLRAYAMGSVLFGRAWGSGQRFVRSAATIARSGIDHVLLQTYLSGGYKGVAGSQPIMVESGDVCVLDCAETLETVATDFDIVTMVIPRPMIEPALPNPGGLHGLVLKADTPLCRLLVQHLEALFAIAPRLTFDECEYVVSGTVALAIGCIRGELEQRDELASSAASISLLKIRRFIDGNLTSPNLDVDQLATRFALSRASLYRLFEPIGGVASYVRRRRLHRAFYEITTPRLRHRKISDIARQLQFGNESSFTRTFKAAYGITPSAARDASAAVRLAPRTVENEGMTMLTRWITEIAPAGDDRLAADAATTARDRKR